MMDREEARRIAANCAPGDPEQQRITEEALLEVGHGVVTVREVPEALGSSSEPRWQAFRHGHPISFGGLFIYGGASREEAIESAVRIASKWDWPTDLPEPSELRES
jgi:hypothetical protein